MSGDLREPRFALLREELMDICRRIDEDEMRRAETEDAARAAEDTLLIERLEGGMGEDVFHLERERLTARLDECRQMASFFCACCREGQASEFVLQKVGALGMPVGEPTGWKHRIVEPWGLELRACQVPSPLRERMEELQKELNALPVSVVPR